MQTQKPWSTCTYTDQCFQEMQSSSILEMEHSLGLTDFHSVPGIRLTLFSSCVYTAQHMTQIVYSSAHFIHCLPMQKN